MITMVDKALTVHLRNSSPLMICPHYGSKQTELGERKINLLFPLVWQGITFGQIAPKENLAE